MSVQDPVASDYGVINASARADAPERRIWRLVQVAPDPNKHNFFYAVQELAGEWRRRTRAEVELAESAPPMHNLESTEHRRGRLESEVIWVARDPAEPPVTRVIYAYLDAHGIMRNLNQAASQGKTGGAA